MKKNLLKLSLALVGACMWAQNASAQFDVYSTLRSIVMAPPTLLTAAAATVTNGPIDIGGYLGNASIDLLSFTNSGGALTATVEMSSNTTNWTTLVNYALISGTTSYSYTNTSNPAFSTNVFATNPYLLPGTFTIPTPYSASFQTPYLAPLPFTNSGAITVTAKGIYRIGFRAQDALRYLHVIWTPTGTSSNDVVAATFNGLRTSEVQ